MFSSSQHIKLSLEVIVLYLYLTYTSITHVSLFLKIFNISNTSVFLYNNVFDMFNVDYADSIANANSSKKELIF